MKIKIKDIPEKTKDRICKKYRHNCNCDGCPFRVLDSDFEDIGCIACDDFCQECVELDGENLPTNREWMESLSDDELSRFLTLGLGIDDIGTYVAIDGVKRMFTQSQTGVEEWLSKPCQWLNSDET